MTHPPGSHPPLIFDRPLLRRRLARALGQGAEDFLLVRAAEDLRERLSLVKRGFSHVLDLGTPRPAAVAMLAGALPQAELVRLAPGPEARNAGWRCLIGDEERLPLAPGVFDLVVSCLALHAVNDLPGALVQMRRALKPDGLFLGCLLGGDTLSELRQAFATAESEILGGSGPRVAPFADVRSLGGLLQRAGFALPVADTEPLVVRYRSLDGLFRDLRGMGAGNAMALRHKAPLTRTLLARMAEVYEERFADPDGRLRATFDVVWLSGWAPHESQQRPLKPGSARMSLAAALNPDG